MSDWVLNAGECPPAVSRRGDRESKFLAYVADNAAGGGLRVDDRDPVPNEVFFCRKLGQGREEDGSVVSVPPSFARGEVASPIDSTLMERDSSSSPGGMSVDRKRVSNQFS